MQFHYIMTNENDYEECAYKKWLKLGYGFTNGDRKYGEKLEEFKPGDLVFMYVNDKDVKTDMDTGIKAVGMVIKKWDGIEYKELMISSLHTKNEYRIEINWFIVIPDGFVSPEEVRKILGYGLSQTTARINKVDERVRLLRCILEKLE